MNQLETITALVQQMAAAGLHIVERKPITVEGPTAVAMRFRQVTQYLRERLAAEREQQNLDAALADLVLPGGTIRWPILSPLPWSNAEAELLPYLGRMVWLGDQVFRLGRLEAVFPGVALVTPSPLPLPDDPVDAFKARTERALPFSLALVEPTHEAHQPSQPRRPNNPT